MTDAMTPSDDAWLEPEKTPDQITVKEINDLMASIRKQEDVVELAEKKLSNEKEILLGYREKVLSHLKALNMRNFRDSDGYLASTVRKRSWALPKGEDWTKFADFLKREGLYENMVSIHSAKFNSFVGERYEEAEKNGNAAGFSLPGVGQEAVIETLRIVKGKSK